MKAGARRASAALALVLLASLPACGEEKKSARSDAAKSSTSSTSPSTETTPSPTGSDLADYEVEPPPRLTERLVGGDILIYDQSTLSTDLIDKVAHLKGVVATDQISMAQVSIENRAVTVAAVNPATYRRFTAAGNEQEIWERVAKGEVAVPAKVGKALRQKDDFLQLGNDKSAPRVHIGAYADQVERVDIVLNDKWGDELGMIDGNALLVATGVTSPQSIQPKLQKILGKQASVQILGPNLDINAQLIAIPTGGSVASLVGSFSYRAVGGRSIQPDPGWVAENIRVEDVPILGRVTCHKVMLPQLRAALREIQERGLADKIHVDEYAGCYYPRFIAGTSNLSNHAFGIALDLNVPGNQRGTVGEMDRTVVSIFNKWGFAWGGTWNWTDPMHFELSELVKVG